MELFEKDSGTLSKSEIEPNGQQTTPETQSPADLPPEFCHYRDEGCEMADSCLHCPFPKCVHDRQGGGWRLLKLKRDREIVRLFTDEGKEIKDLAAMFRVSVRTVRRALGRKSGDLRFKR